ncbi:hypothetical protein BB560_006835, partial [Smittium megazygosporum]
MYTALKSIIWLLSFSNGVLSSLAPNYESGDKEMNLFRRQRGALVDASKFTQSCPVNRQTLSTS